MSKVETEKERARLHAIRASADLWFEILRKGIGHTLSDGYRCDPEDLELVLSKINNELANAMKDCQLADEAYRPYFRRLRHRRIKTTVFHPKKKGTK